MRTLYVSVLVIWIAGSLSQIATAQNTADPRTHGTKWVPKLEDRVTDLAKLFSNDRRRALIEILTRYESETTHQIAVLTVPSLRGESMESFSLRVANAWGIGHRGLDNGVLVTLAPTERRVRIEVGYGLEKAIPDELALQIAREDMIPAFRRGDYVGGIEAGVRSLMKAARRYVIPPDKRPDSGRLRGEEKGTGYFSAGDRLPRPLHPS